MGTSCAFLVADLFLVCCEKDFMVSLSDDEQVDSIDAFNTTSRYMDTIFSTNYIYFDNVVIMFLKEYPLEAKTAPKN